MQWIEKEVRNSSLSKSFEFPSLENTVNNLPRKHFQGREELEKKEKK